MSGNLLVVLVVLGAFVLVTLLGRLGEARETGRLPCPVSDEHYDVLLAKRLTLTWRTGPTFDVVRCSAFGDGAVPCAKSCIHDT